MLLISEVCFKEMSLRRQASSRATSKSPLFVNSTIDLFLQQFSQFLHRHVTENKSETVLVTGPPSCGKTKLLEYIFNKFHHDESSLAKRLLIFRLNGLIHSIESSAIQEISSQYDIQTKTINNYQCDHLQILLEIIANENKNYFIFILDHFEQFTYQKLNSILYTLFDTVYLNKKTYSILTIAVSNRSDCLELPEKRIKSRFSQIYFILSSPSIDEYTKYILQLYKTKKPIQIHHNLLNSLTDIEQKIIYYLRDSNVNMNEQTQVDNVQFNGCLTHLELLLLLMTNNVLKRIDEKLNNQINESDNDDEEIHTGILTDTKFTFDQIYHEYSKYVLKNQKYYYEKAVIRKVNFLSK